MKQSPVAGHQSNPEWELLKLIVEANNSGNKELLYKIISENDFSDTTMAATAALNSISLIDQEIIDNHVVLTAFSKAVSGDLDFRSTIRLAMLEERLSVLVVA